MSTTRRRRSALTNGSAESSNNVTAFSTGLDSAEHNFEVQKQNAQLEGERSALSRRFWLGSNDLNREVEIVVLDRKIKDIVSLHEHQIWDPVNRKMSYEVCLDKLGNAKPFDCPLCAQGNRPGYVVLLTILDLTPFETKDGEQRDYSRKLLPIKSNSISQLSQYLKRAEEKYGTIRGTNFVMKRTSTGQDSPTIGVPQLLENDQMFDHINEQDMINEFGHPRIMSKDGKSVIAEENGLLEPFDYNKLLKIPTFEYFQQKYGAHAAAGSDNANYSSGGNYTPPSNTDSEDTPQPSQPTRRRRRSANTEQPPSPVEPEGAFGDEEV